MIYDLTDDIKTMLVLGGINSVEMVAEYAESYAKNTSNIHHSVIFFQDKKFPHKLHSAFSMNNSYDGLTTYPISFKWEMGDNVVGFVTTSISTDPFLGERLQSNMDTKKHRYMADISLDGDVNLTFRFPSSDERNAFLDFINSNTVEF